MVLRALATALLGALLFGGCKGGGNDITGPSSTSCTAGPYTFDLNVSRCRASDGQFALNSCCGR